MNKTSLKEKFAMIQEHWRPKVIAQLNGQEVKLVKIEGIFPWHHHIPELNRHFAPPDQKHLILAFTSPTIGWLLFGLIALYLLGFEAIVFSGGRVARALDAAGLPVRFLDFLYGWLANLLGF